MDIQTDKKIEEVLYEERYRKTNRQILGTFDYENVLKYTHIRRVFVLI